MASSTDFSNVGRRTGVVPSPADTTKTEAKFNNVGTSSSSGRVWKAIVVTSAVIAVVATVAAVVFFALAMPVLGGIALGLALLACVAVKVSRVTSCPPETAAKFLEIAEEDQEQVIFQENISRFPDISDSGAMNIYDNWRNRSLNKIPLIRYKCNNMYKVLYYDTIANKQVLKQWKSCSEADVFYREKQRDIFPQ